MTIDDLVNLGLDRYREQLSFESPVPVWQLERYRPLFTAIAQMVNTAIEAAKPDPCSCDDEPSPYEGIDRSVDLVNWLEICVCGHYRIEHSNGGEQGTTGPCRVKTLYGGVACPCEYLR